MAGGLISFCYVCYVFTLVVKVSYPRNLGENNVEKTVNGSKTGLVFDVWG